jgi:anti-sigma factor ChrR (cupin superfamily)
MAEPDMHASPSAPHILHADELPWVQSPTPGVWRKRLEHSGPSESGRVTSIVRYDAGSVFPVHPHPDGEEILVLEGVFSDEHGHYPAGTFLLHAEGFSHAPFSSAGCLLFVKLRQAPGARTPLRIDTHAGWAATEIAGVERLELYAAPALPDARVDGSPGARTHLTRVAAGVRVGPIAFPEGEEILVLEGEFNDEYASYRRHSWVRFPPGGSHTLRTDRGCTLYVQRPLAAPH